MDNPRPEKVAVVEEVQARLDRADAVMLTEYRGLSVAQITDLRRQLRAAGAEYKVYKNTLVRFAARNLELDIEDMLTGPTALAFVGEGLDGSAADPVAVAKVLRTFSRDMPALVVKGGVLGRTPIDADGARALADMPTRDQLLARLAGGFAAPMTKFAGLLQALPRNFAYGLSALVAQKSGSDA